MYNKARKKYNKYPTQQNKTVLQNASNAYKKTMNKYINTYNKENEIKLRQLHSKKPKDYWKFLNKIKNKKQVKGPDLQNLYEHFKTLNNSDNNNNEDENEDDIINNPNVNAHENNNCLNCPLTVDEIRKCINSLKNNKSPGIDKVLNEYIKCTSDKMLPIYDKMFNLILETGIIPQNWCYYSDI